MIKYEIISKYSQIHPEKSALCDGRISITWREFEKNTAKLMSSLRGIGSNGNPCIFISSNSLDVVLLGAAFSSLGVPFQGLDYHLSAETLKRTIEKIGASHVFISKSFSYLLSYLKDVCNVHELELWLSNAKNDELMSVDILSVEKQSGFKSYAFTSGTTGIPKIVYRTNSFDKRRFSYLEKRYSFNNKDIHLACLPMYHVSSTGWLRLFLSLGCTVVVHDYQTAYHLCEVFHYHNVSTTILSPIMLKELLGKIEKNIAKQYFPYLRFIMTGGKNCPIFIKKEAIEKLGPIIHEYYGTTETGVNTLLDPEEALKYPGSVGKAFDGNSIEILDKNDLPVNMGSIGKIAISSYMNMDSYVSHDANFLMLNHDSYLITSDYGYKNEDGYLFIVQRASHAKPKIYDFYSMENEVLKLPYVSDVFMFDSEKDHKVHIQIVPSKYYPYDEMMSDLGDLYRKYGVSSAEIKVLSHLGYTLTGKIKIAELLQG